MRKTLAIAREIVPVLAMITLIPFVADDYLLTLIYILMIAALLRLRCERHDFLALGIGFFFMLISESFFINTGVETFARHTLFGIMPLWLPFLWAYGFVVIKRTMRIVDC